MNPKYLGYALAWACFIFILSILPGKDLPQVRIQYFDKIAHLIIYAILAWLLYKTQKNMSELKVWVFVFLLPILYGVFIEYFQGTFLNDRITDVYDMIANAIGVMVTFIWIRVLK